MAIGVWIAVFNWYRHVEMARKRRAGIRQNISGTPLMGSVFFFLGWYVTPLGFTPWILAWLLTELGNVTFVDVEAGDVGQPAEREPEG